MAGSHPLPRKNNLNKKKSVFLCVLNPHPGSESPLPGLRKLDLTRENLNTLLGHGFSKHKATSTLSRGSGHTTGGHAPGRPRRERESWLLEDSGCRHDDHNHDAVVFVY